MAKAKPPDLVRWQVTIIRGARGLRLGTIRAPDDEAAARKAAIEQFGITDPRELRGLALARIRET